MEVVKAPNLKTLKKSHEDKWVALSRGYEKVVASAETLRALEEKVDMQEVVVMRVLPSGVGYAPGSRA